MQQFVERLLDTPAVFWVGMAFVPIAVLFIVALWRADRGGSSAFKLIHFVTSDTGRGSNAALGYTMLVVVSAWGMWALIVLDRLTEWYMLAVIGGFVVGGLGARFATVKAKMEGVPDANASAGDADAPPAAAMERTTQTTETVRVPANPLAAGGTPIPVQVANKQPIATTETPRKKGAKR